MRVFIVGIILLAGSTIVSIAGQEDVKLRQNAMQQVRETVKVLFPMAKGKSEFDDFLVISMLEQMLDAATPYATYFPKEVEVDVHSEAAGTIWTDREGFELALNNFLTDIEVALKAEPATLEEFKPLFSKVVSNCQTCHKVYRMK